jgi:uncharacterized protein (TIGR02646 family)
MIFVERNNKPQILIDYADTWTKEYLEARNDYEGNKTPEQKKLVEKAEKKYNHNQVKDSLKIMFQKKCAFCESLITHVDYGQIEHFKPKSSYPGLCFDWNNFLLCCSICNGKSNKGDKFPLADEGGPFVNPTEENPDDFFGFEYDSLLKKFIVFPKHERAKTMLGIININREDLLEHRTEYLSKIVDTISQIIEKDQEKLDLFCSYFSEKDEYYAFIKNIFEKVKNNI